MTYQQAIVPMIDDAYRGLWSNARPLADRLDFKAGEATRSPLDILRECATVAGGLTPILRARAMVGSEEDYAMIGEITAGLNTVEACEAHFESTKAELYRAIEEFPEELLPVPIETPWGTFPWRDFIAYLYWNPMYHTGQLAYIQMIHGDTAMH